MLRTTSLSLSPNSPFRPRTKSNTPSGRLTNIFFIDLEPLLACFVSHFSVACFVASLNGRGQSFLYVYSRSLSRSLTFQRLVRSSKIVVYCVAFDLWPHPRRGIFVYRLICHALRFSLTGNVWIPFHLSPIYYIRYTGHISFVTNNRYDNKWKPIIPLVL